MLAIIPARGGSKGLPGKNIKLLDGKPLIAYAILAAAKSKYIDRIVVSTDDEKIAAISLQYGADVPFLRPARLAGDTSKAIDNFLYSIAALEEYYGEKFADFIVLQPTSPLRKPCDIDGAIELFNDKAADSVVSICKAEHHPVWAKKMDSDGLISRYFENGTENLNRQEIEAAYMPNGAIYIMNFKMMETRYSYYSDKTYGYIMPKERSVDIDTEIDFEFAEFLIKSRGL